MSTTVSIAEFLLALGGMFLIGMIADLIGRHSPIPRVTLLLVAGIAIGPYALDWIPATVIDVFPALTTIALTMVGFLLGQKLTLSELRELGRPVASLSISIVISTIGIVFAVLYLIGVPVPVALLLGGVASATAPAATIDVVQQSGIRNRFSAVLLDVVAIDDAWGLLLFSILLAIAQSITGTAGALEAMWLGVYEIFGAIAIGVTIGVPAAYLTGRIRPGQPTQAEALGIVMLTAGAAEIMGVSYILAAVALGATIANLARHHATSFDEIEGLEWPFLILFFLLAGASLPLTSVTLAGVICAAYIVARIAGRLLGAYIGSQWAGPSGEQFRPIGLAMLPQAGIAIGLALLASQRFPQFAPVILSVVLASTIVFELIGPVITNAVLKRMAIRAERRETDAS